ncbi:MAG: diguanylate cyclase [Chitinivibrionales bacterium]|nr:diguanylate cyclase [Chitinivibrionales bacterium]
MIDRIDELQAKIVTTTEITEQIDLYNELAWEYRLKDRTKLHHFSQEAHALSTTGRFAESHYKKGIIASLRNLSYISNFSYKFDQAISQGLDALGLLESQEYPVVKIDVLQNIGWANFSLSNYEEACEFYNKGVVLARQLGDKRREANMANTLCITYGELNDLTAAEKSFDTALKLFIEMEDRRGEAIVNNNMALVYEKFKRFDDALHKALYSHQLAQQYQFIPIIEMSLDTLTLLCIAKADFAQALVYADQFWRCFENRSDRQEAVRPLLYYGTIYYHIDNAELCQRYLGEAIVVAEKFSRGKELYECYELLSKHYERHGMMKEAFEHFKKFSTIRNNTQRELREKRLAALKAAHKVETAKRNAEIYRLGNIALQEEISQCEKNKAQLEEMVISDPLTGLNNRRYFFENAQRILEQALATQNPLSVLMADVDHFKRVNDTHGHGVGDQVLVTISKLLRQNVRTEDMVCRYGGEEFVILLYGHNQSQAWSVAERIREKIQETILPLLSGILTVTISVGIATFVSGQRCSIDALIEQADNALYEAKKNGRNQTIIFTPPYSTSALAP